MIKDLILKKHFIDFQDAWQIKDDDESMVFEKFVNYVILSQDEVNTFVGHPDLLDICSPGGGDDAKLDGIGIKINGQLVGSIDDINDVIASNKKINIEFFVIQAKERTDFDSSAVNTFGIGVKNFFSEPVLPENEKVKELRALKDYIFNDEKVLRKLEANPSLCVYYVFCGTTPVDDHTSAIKKLLIDGVKSSSACFGSISFEIIDGQHLTEKCKDLENDFKTKLIINDIIPLTVNNNELIKTAYAFTCDAVELLKLLTKEDKTLRRSLFNSNVRDFLGNRGGVNSEIEDTIKSDPEMFLMCNNGITIVCTEFLQIRDKIVSIDNPQIVNGCQTCTTIYLQRDNPSLSKVQVLVKLICTEDGTITNKVVRGTNKQNQVLEESFETTKPYHISIEDFFHAKADPIQLYYERRNKQYSSVSTIDRYKIVNLRVITQTFVATFLQSPHKAHRHESKLLQEYASSDKNRMIFRKNQSPYSYYISALIWYRFEDAFRRHILYGKHDRTYIAHLYYIFMFVTGQYPIKVDARKDAMDNFCKQMEKVLVSDTFDDYLRKIKDIFSRCEKEWVSKGNSRFVIKESNDFVEELTILSREIFVNKTVALKNLDTEENWIEGNILSYLHRDSWYAFIISPACDDNVYFDRRAFSGNVRKLIPGQKCKFILSSKIVDKEEQFFATKVELI